jgi:hypothetical protein
MNTRITNYLIVAFAALLVGAAIPRLSSVELPATAPVQPLVSSPPAEQYLVVDASQVPVGNPKRAAPTLETILNDYGAQGWRVRTAMPPFIILAR